MADDYRSAALRLFRDADTLATASCIDTAGHLIGFSAECALKAGVAQLTQANAPQGHFPRLIAAARQSVSGRRQGPLLIALGKSDLMAGWNVNDRYAPDNHVSLAQYSKWKADTELLLRSVGLIR